MRRLSVNGHFNRVRDDSDRVLLKVDPEVVYVRKGLRSVGDLRRNRKSGVKFDLAFVSAKHPESWKDEELGYMALVDPSFVHLDP